MIRAQVRHGDTYGKGSLLMTRHFTVPSGDEVLDATGLVPSPEGSSVDTRAIVLNLGGEDSLKFSYSAVERSVRFVWTREDQLLLDLFREGATLMEIDSRNSRITLRVEFDFNDVRGAIDVVVTEGGVEMQDRMLWV
jgi:hypothetical protein